MPDPSNADPRTTKVDPEAAAREVNEAYERIRTEVHKVIVGQDAVLTELLSAMFCGGHALVVGVLTASRVLQPMAMAAGQKEGAASSQQATAEGPAKNTTSTVGRSAGRTRGPGWRRRSRDAVPTSEHSRWSVSATTRSRASSLTISK